LEKHGKSDANEAVLHELRLHHALLHQENYHHSYPHCWRSKNPVIFRAMDQWFIEIDHTAPSANQTFRKRAVAEIDSVAWIPEWGVNRIKGAVESRPDWCISRQRTWGVPIPAFYDAKGEPMLDAQIVRNAADLVEKHGSNIWFEKSATELWSLLKPKDWKGAEAVAKSNDTLDVWIDSGSSSRSVLMRRPELHEWVPEGEPTRYELTHYWANKKGEAFIWQADMYLEGSDQHRGWFQSSLLLSLAGNGAAPYKTVLTHGFMVDADREKISKSKQGQGAYEKPQTAEAYVKRYGADIVRLWVSSQDFRSDIVVSEERIAKVAETYRGIRNALRYQLSNIYDFDPAKHSVADDKLTGLDRWILGEFAKLEKDVIDAYDKYEFHVVYQKVSQFIAVELSSIYHDVIKDRLYTDAANSHRRRSTQTALHRLVTGLCKMLAPVLVFTADEAWDFVPGKTVESIHGTGWQPSDFTVAKNEQEDWKVLFDTRTLVLPELEKARQSKTIGKSLDAKIELLGYTKESLVIQKRHADELRELLNVSQLEIGTAPRKEGTSAWFPNVKKADGQKCERCWHWETDIGSNPEHPTICERCVKAVSNESGRTDSNS
jgi:isoleucyl-tRNA synthetase